MLVFFALHVLDIPSDLKIITTSTKLPQYNEFGHCSNSGPLKTTYNMASQFLINKSGHFQSKLLRKKKTVQKLTPKQLSNLLNSKPLSASEIFIQFVAFVSCSFKLSFSSIRDTFLSEILNSLELISMFSFKVLSNVAGILF